MGRYLLVNIANGVSCCHLPECVFFVFQGFCGDPEMLAPYGIALCDLGVSDGGSDEAGVCGSSMGYCGRCAEYAGDDVSPDITVTGGVTKSQFKSDFLLIIITCILPVFSIEFLPFYVLFL